MVATAPDHRQKTTKNMPAVQDSQQVRFKRWVADFRARAAARGVSSGTLDATLGHVKLVPKILGRDRSQPEFSRRVWSYLDSLVSAHRVRLGQEQLATYADIAAHTEQRYGVPRHIIGAIWGIESNYGRNFGSYGTVDALATLAFDGRRRSFAVKQLYAIFKIVDSGAIAARELRGSWAGAMGHTQFLPTSYLAYAKDGDGDGRIDIWNSIDDVMASTANYLTAHGWQAGSRWGVEVTLPSGFDYAQAALAVKRSTGDWQARGVGAVTGGTLPRYAKASILAPAGARGPAFLVGPNFGVIMSYNHSINYALAVGLLADRLAGRPGVQQAWPRHLAALSRDQVVALQRMLNRKGYAVGTPDGIIGANTRKGIRQYQHAHGLVADGFATRQLVQRLRGEANGV